MRVRMRRYPDSLAMELRLDLQEIATECAKLRVMSATVALLRLEVRGLRGSIRRKRARARRLKARIESRRRARTTPEAT